MVREFEYATEATVLEEEGLEFKFPGDDRVLHAFQPGSGQLAMLMSRMSRHTTVLTKVAGVIDFFVGCLDDEDSAHVAERLLDGKDRLGIEDVTPVMEWLLAEWSGRPTK